MFGRQFDDDKHIRFEAALQIFRTVTAVVTFTIDK